MEPVRTGLRNIMGKLLRARPADEALLLAWPIVCGKQVAARTQALTCAQGSLTVEVPDQAWCAQLSAFSLRYIRGFEELLGPVVKEVKFVAKQSASSNQHSAKLGR